MKLILLLAALLLPAAVRAAEVLACPAWEITVVDGSLRPLAGCAIAQEWGCTFKAGYVGATTNAVTDAAGKVLFPARIVSSPPAATSRWKRIRRALDGPENPQPAATVFISKPGYRSEWIRRLDPGVVAGRDGLRLHLVLKAEKP